MEATEVRQPRPSEGLHRAAIHHPFVPSPLSHLPGPRGRAKPSVVDQAQRKIRAAAALRLSVSLDAQLEEYEHGAKAYKVFH